MSQATDTHFGGRIDSAKCFDCFFILSLSYSSTYSSPKNIGLVPEKFVRSKNAIRTDAGFVLTLFASLVFVCMWSLTSDHYEVFFRAQFLAAHTCFECLFHGSDFLRTTQQKNRDRFFIACLKQRSQRRKLRQKLVQGSKELVQCLPGDQYFLLFCWSNFGMGSHRTNPYMNSALIKGKSFLLRKSACSGVKVGADLRSQLVAPSIQSRTFARL